MPRRPGARWAALVALFLLHSLPYLARPALIGGDEPHYALMTRSLAVDGDVELEPDYQRVEAGASAAGRKFAHRTLERHLVERRGTRYFSHPLGLPALAAPLVALQQWLSPGGPPDLVLGILGLASTFVGLLLGTRLLRGIVDSRRDALLVAFAVYFSTPLWFYSRLFFTETYSWSLVVIAAYLMTRQRWVPGSLVLGFTFLVKETNLLLILGVLACGWRLAGRRRALLLSLGPLAAFAAWVLKNLWIYGEALVTAQPYAIGDPLAGMIGLLIDPRHGLLPFAPVLVLALAALGGTRAQLPRGISVTLWATFAAFYLMTAFWIDWTGGSCYGPRLLVPVIPLLAVPLAVSWSRLRSRWPGRAAFIALTGLGFAVQLCAVTNPFKAFWSVDFADLVTANLPWFLVGTIVGTSVVASLATRGRGDPPRS